MTGGSIRFDHYRCSVVILTVMTLFIMAGRNASSVAGGYGWSKALDDICLRISESRALTLEELCRLADRCDKLKLQAEQPGETER